MFYLATGPDLFEPIVKSLKKNGLKGKLVIEKPFGNDYSSADSLNKVLNTNFSEKDIYRIDHYLGKETVQNIFAFRFSNKVFESVWNSEDIEKIEIVAAEKVGVGTRAGYYDKYGALKDMVQNHLLQLLSIIAMEPPKEFTEEQIQKNKVQVLENVHITGSVFGRYKGYAKEPKIPENTKTETYAKVRLEVKTPRWKGTAFVLETGKKLKKKSTHVLITFRQSLFKKKNNQLRIQIQPNEAITLTFNAKDPNEDEQVMPVNMEFCHQCIFGYNTPEAYEKLLSDAMKSRKLLFTSWQEVSAAWKILDSIKISKILEYEQGSDGPVIRGE